MVIPVSNEEGRIKDVVRSAVRYADEVLVVDDGSTDRTAIVAEAVGACVIQRVSTGYIAAIKHGFREASGDVVVTMDGDGEHQAKDIPRPVQPIRDGKADLVLGQRPEVIRLSERFLNWLAGFRVKVRDSGTGFRALRRDLELNGRCICGISVLEPAAMGARIVEVPIELQGVEKPRPIAWFHLPQVWYVLRWLLHTASL